MIIQQSSRQGVNLVNSGITFAPGLVIFAVTFAAGISRFTRVVSKNMIYLQEVKYAFRVYRVVTAFLNSDSGGCASGESIEKLVQMFRRRNEKNLAFRRLLKKLNKCKSKYRHVKNCHTGSTRCMNLNFIEGQAIRFKYVEFLADDFMFLLPYAYCQR
uniref:Uncharacterized protein n=1 Tax=Glossina pallidipes TaxID=7398 RepID=A0A1A9ZBE0_GLOPL